MASTSNSNAGVGVHAALRDSDTADFPERWITYNMEYGNFYKVPRAKSPIAKRVEAHVQKEVVEVQRPQTVPNLNLDVLHQKCERKWEMLAKQLEECRSEVEQLRLAKQSKPPDNNSKTSPRTERVSPRNERISPRSSPKNDHVCDSTCDGYDDYSIQDDGYSESPNTRSQYGKERGRSSPDRSPGRSLYGDRGECGHYADRSYRSDRGSSPRSYDKHSKEDRSKSPNRVLNICIRTTPSSTVEEDHTEDNDKCERCKMLEKEQEEWESHQQSIRTQPSSSPIAAEQKAPKRTKKKWRKKTPITPPVASSRDTAATSKYNYYKYYGFAGRGAKTSWGHNFPLGVAPPYSIKAPPDFPEIK